MSMTKEEHALIVAMFARQTMLTGLIIEMMKSIQAFQPDDPIAYDAMWNPQDQQWAPILKTTRDVYKETARKLGLDVPIE